MYKTHKDKKAKILTIAVLALLILSVNVQIIGSHEIKKHDLSKAFIHTNYKNRYLNPILPPSSPNKKDKKILYPNDEGSHNTTKNKIQEWWYFNGLIKSADSELDNWSFMISFNKMKTADIFFATLYDDKNSSYGGSSIHWPGKIKAEIGPGMNVSYKNNANANGLFPDWSIYVEDNRTVGTNITYRLNYHANSKPHWLFFNSGRNKTNSVLGHYSILNCTITGNITINNETYDIFGYGYHEHHWFTYFDKININNNKENKRDLERTLNVWDWYYICLDNGWNLFIPNILQGTNLGKILPSPMWITADGENFSKCFYYKIEYVKTTNTSMESAVIPEKVRIRGFFLSTLLKNPLKGLMYVDFEIENVNICEMTFGNPPETGVWEGPCKIKGHVRLGFKKIGIKGKGIAEMTRG